MICGTKSAAPSGTRANSICFLRLVFASFVVYSHSWYLGGFGTEPLSMATDGGLIAGTLGVQAFFVLSGILVSRSWQRSSSLPRFLWHRALRLIPAFWICLAVTAILLTPLLHFTSPSPFTDGNELAGMAWNYVTHNLASPRADIAIGPYPNGTPHPGDWNGSLWTLFYEGAAYLIVAAFGLCLLLGRLQKIGLGLLLALLFLNTLWHIHPDWIPHAAARLFDTPGKQLTFYFFAGMAWTLRPDRLSFLDSAWPGPLLLLAGMAVIFSGWHTALGFWLMAPILSWLGRHLPLSDFEKFAGGDYSYGLYLYAYPVQQTLAHFRVHEWGLFPFFAMSFLVALGLGVLSWHFIEKPSLSLKNWSPGSLFRVPATH